MAAEIKGLRDICKLPTFGQHDIMESVARCPPLGDFHGADGQPAMPGLPAADMAVSLMALLGILMALLRRHSTGRGDCLDIALFDSLLAWIPNNVMGPPFAEQRAPVVKDERSWGGAACYGIYATACARHLVLAGSEPKFVHVLLGALGRPELAPLALQAPEPGHEPVRAFLRQNFATRTLAAWTKFLAPLYMAWAPVRTLHEAVTGELAAARQMVVQAAQEGADGPPHLGLLIKFRHDPGQIDPQLDGLGASTEAVLADAGLDALQIAAGRGL